MSVRIGLFMYGWRKRSKMYGFHSLGWISHFLPIEVGLYEAYPFLDPIGCIWSKEILNGYIGDTWGWYMSNSELNE